MNLRTELVNPTRVKLLQDADVNREVFKKDDVITVEDFSAKRLIEKKIAEAVAKSDDTPSANRFSVLDRKATKREENQTAALQEAQKASSGQVRTETTEGATVAAGPGAGANSNTTVKNQ